LRARTDLPNLTLFLGALVALGVSVARPARAQAQGSWLERLGIDKLRFSALGAQVGRVNPYGIEPTTSYSLQVDYGELSPGWRIVRPLTWAS